MENLSSEIVGLIYQLLPGFIVAWVFYGLTSYIKPAAFDQIVQALIFTVIIKVLLIASKFSLLFIGRYYALGKWSDNLELVVSILISIIFGVFVSWCVNNDFPLWLFRKDGIGRYTGIKGLPVKLLSKFNLTEKTLHPTEWYSFFNKIENEYIVLHLIGERRIQGRLIQFPDSPNTGHFIIDYSSWLLDDGNVITMESVDKTLVSSSEVIRIELLKNSIDKSRAEIILINQPIYHLYKGEPNDNKCTKTVS